VSILCAVVALVFGLFSGLTAVLDTNIASLITAVLIILVVIGIVAYDSI
jgi:uncharacterized membrane protein